MHRSMERIAPLVAAGLAITSALAAPEVSPPSPAPASAAVSRTSTSAAASPVTTSRAAGSTTTHAGIQLEGAVLQWVVPATPPPWAAGLDPGSLRLPATPRHRERSRDRARRLERLRSGMGGPRLPAPVPLPGARGLDARSGVGSRRASPPTTGPAPGR